MTIIPENEPIHFSQPIEIDDSSPLAQLMRGELSGPDSLALRKLLGVLSFAEWVDHTDRAEPYRVRDPLLLGAMQTRTAFMARRNALARSAPWLLMPEVQS